eukprot:TRINITY_DN27181_c0_g1_i1.p1 TRINITY_DN27181_c0_g1~~TRINITY_DN27181_c0_g1_i1.p1  ORF type:complete len:216 (-),score=48.02 TRINITY_DN27181_c0_g1_i1:73-720(-)
MPSRLAAILAGGGDHDASLCALSSAPVQEIPLLSRRCRHAKLSTAFLAGPEPQPSKSGRPRRHDERNSGTFAGAVTAGGIAAFLGEHAHIRHNAASFETPAEMASEAESEASAVELHVREAVQEAEAAAEDALAAAQVALFTEIVGALATVAGLTASVIGWKMDDSELPPELKVPPDQGGLPELFVHRGGQASSGAQSSGGGGRLPAEEDGPLEV